MSELARATSIFLDLYQLKPARPDLALLGEVSFNFARLPWENLTKYLRKHRADPVEVPEIPPALRGVSGAERLRLSAEVLEDHAKLGTGGTCFSLTHALRRIATDLGFRVRPVMADMRHGANVHCALLVELDANRWLLDPGYLVAEPVPLHADRPARVAMPGSTLEYRPVGGGGAFELHTLNRRGEELFRYSLRLSPVSDAEFVTYWLESFESTGMNGLHLNRVAGDARISAHNLNLRIDDGTGKRNVKLRDGYVEQVARRFGIGDEVVRRAHAEWERRRCRIA